MDRPLLTNPQIPNDKINTHKTNPPKTINNRPFQQNKTKHTRTHILGQVQHHLPPALLRVPEARSQAGAGRGHLPRRRPAVPTIGGGEEEAAAACVIAGLEEGKGGEGRG
jgi:hypothetical protein